MIYPRHERYAFNDRHFDPRLLFPAAVAALGVVYPNYDFVWDRQKERWIVLVWLAWPNKAHPEPIFEVEGDNGTFRTPDVPFVEYLRATDIDKKAGSIAEYLERSDREYEAFQIARQHQLDERGEDATADWLDYIRRNPSTRSAVAGWRGRHLIATHTAMQESFANSPKGGPGNASHQ